MNEEVVTSGESALPPSGDTGEVATNAQTPSTSTSEGSAVKQTSMQEKPAKVNLNDMPEHRAAVASRDREIAALRKQLSQANAQQEAAHLAGLNEPQREKYLREKAENEVQQLRNELAYRDENAQRDKDIADLSDTYGVPKEILENAATYNAAEKLAKEWQAQVKETARKYDEFASRNEGAKDSSGSGRSTKQTETRFAKAIADNDPVAALSALFED